MLIHVVPRGTEEDITGSVRHDSRPGVRGFRFGDVGGTFGGLAMASALLVVLVAGNVQLLAVNLNSILVYA